MKKNGTADVLKMDVGGFFVTLQVIPFNNIAHDLLLNKFKVLDKSLAI